MSTIKIVETDMPKFHIEFTQPETGTEIREFFPIVEDEEEEGESFFDIFLAAWDKFDPCHFYHEAKCQIIWASVYCADLREPKKIFEGGYYELKEKCERARQERIDIMNETEPYVDEWVDDYRFPWDADEY